MGRSTTSKSVVTFAGIDYHKKFSVVSLGDCNGNLLEQHKLINDEKLLIEFFSQFPGLACAVESSRAFEWFVDLLVDLGVRVHVCNPRQVKLIAQTAFKTDKRDSKVLMVLLAKNFLPESYMPTAKERELRERLRWRVSVVRSATRLKLRIHALLDKEHKGWTGKDLFKGAGRKYLQEVELSKPRRALLDKALELLAQLESQLDQEEDWISRQVRKNPQAKLLTTVPGFGNLSALTMVAELGDVTRFRRAEQVAAYFGLVPSESSSGDHRTLGRITKQGSPLVRWLLVQDAWIAVNSDWKFKNKFNQICKRRGKKVAIIAIARRLAETAYCILRDGVPYNPTRSDTGSARACALPHRQLEEIAAIQH
jgi:transposase